MDKSKALAQKIAAFLEGGAGMGHEADWPYADCECLERATIDGSVNLVALAKHIQEAE